MKRYFTSSAVSDDFEVASDNPSLITPTTTTPVLVKAKVQEALKNEMILINSGLLKRTLRNVTSLQVQLVMMSKLRLTTHH